MLGDAAGLTAECARWASRQRTRFGAPGGALSTGYELDDEDELDVEDELDEVVLLVPDELEPELVDVLDEEFAPDVAAGAFDSEEVPLPEPRESVR